MKDTRSSWALFLVAVVWLALVANPAGPAALVLGEESKTKILLLATPPDHPYGSHMYEKWCRLLAECLKQQPGVEAVVSVGWPTDPAMLEDVRAIAVYSSPGDFVIRGPHREAFEKLMRGGVGFSAMHWGTGAMPETAQQYKSYLGGYFMGKFGLNTTTTTLEQIDANHPICRGWSNFQLLDEIYLNPELMPATQGVVKVSVPSPGETTPKDQIVAWVYQRPDSNGGRSFGCTLGHFHALFSMEPFRRLFVNGILWTAGVEIPAGGAACQIDPSQLELPPDPKIVAQVKQFDKNGDGDLDGTELDSLLQGLIQQQKETPLFMRFFDKDQDGKLSAKESEQIYPVIKARFLQQCRTGMVNISAASTK